jgi:hypothetical protein
VTRASCKHTAFDGHVVVNNLEDTGQFMVDLTIKCRQCGTPFQFLGLKPGLDLQGATCSVDALEARLAVCPEGQRPNPLDRMAFGVRRADG